MRWQGKLIDRPLTNMPQEYVPIAIQLFKNLMGYMGDLESSKKPPLEHIKKLLKIVLSAPSEVRDECYVQVLKQIKQHRVYANALRGWKALALLASTSAPSAELCFSVMNFLLTEIKTNEDDNVLLHANYIISRLYHIFLRARKNVP